MENFNYNKEIRCYYDLIKMTSKWGGKDPEIRVRTQCLKRRTASIIYIRRATRDVKGVRAPHSECVPDEISNQAHPFTYCDCYCFRVHLLKASQWCLRRRLTSVSCLFKYVLLFHLFLFCFQFNKDILLIYTFKQILLNCKTL